MNTVKEHFTRFCDKSGQRMMLGILRYLELGFLLFYCQVDSVHCSFLPPLTDTWENETVLNVTGYFNYHIGVEVVVVMENVTWYTAAQACMDLGYSKLDNAHKYHMRTSLTAALLNETPGYGNTALWTGLYKPDVNVNVWVSVNYGFQCNVIEFPDFDEMNAEHQCAVNVYDNMGNIPSLRTRNCSTLLGFQCVKWVADLSNYTQYDGYIVQGKPPKTGTHVNSFNLATCLDYCDSRAFCIGFTYNTTNNKCSSYLYTEFGEAFVNYSLTYIGGNVNHYTKTGVAGILVEDVDSSVLQGNVSFECSAVSTSTHSFFTRTSSMASRTATSSYPSGSSPFPSSTMNPTTSSEVPVTSLASSLIPSVEQLNKTSSSDISSPSSLSGVSISSTLSDTSSTAIWSEWFTSGMSSTSNLSTKVSFGSSSAVLSTEKSTLSTSNIPSTSLNPSDMSSGSTSSYVSQSRLSDTSSLLVSGSSTSVTSETGTISTSPKSTSTSPPASTSWSSSETTTITTKSLSSASATLSSATTSSISLSPWLSSSSSFSSSSLPTPPTPSPSSSSTTKTISLSSTSATSSVSLTTQSTAISSQSTIISSIDTAKTASSISLSTSAAVSTDASSTTPSSPPSSSTVSLPTSPEVGISTTSDSSRISTTATKLFTVGSFGLTFLPTFTNFPDAPTYIAPSRLTSHDRYSTTLSNLLSVYFNITFTSASTLDESSIPQSPTASLTTESFLSSSVETPSGSSSVSVPTDPSSTAVPSSETSSTSVISSTESESQFTEISTELLISTPQTVCGCRDYCPSQAIQNDTEIDEVVNLLVRNLTINPRETNKYKQSLMCVEDDRVSSKAIAAISVSIVSILFGSIVVSDLCLLLNLFKQTRLDHMGWGR